MGKLAPAKHFINALRLWSTSPTAQPPDLYRQTLTKLVPDCVLGKPALGTPGPTPHLNFDPISLSVMQNSFTLSNSYLFLRPAPDAGHARQLYPFFWKLCHLALFANCMFNRDFFSPRYSSYCRAHTSALSLMVVFWCMRSAILRSVC